MNLKRFSAFLAALLLAASILPACKNNNNTSNETTNGATEGFGTVTSETQLTVDIPDDVDMDGKTFTVLSSSWYGYTPLSVVDIFPETSAEDFYQAAAYNRALYVTERLNCDIVHQEAVNLEDYLAKLNQSVMVDPVYDVSLSFGTSLNASISNNYLANLDEVDHIDLTASWWNNGQSDSFRIGGKLFAALGDVTLNQLNAAQFVIYNKDMAKDIKIDDVNEVVADGQWTYDKMYEFAKVATQDLDNSGSLNKGDKVGFTYLADGFVPMLISAGVSLLEVDNGGEVVFAADSDKSINRIEAIVDIVNDVDYGAEGLRQNPDLNGCWVDGDVLFHFAGTHQSASIRNCEPDVGILPLPKFDEQDEYLGSVYTDYTTFVTVPYNNSDYENTGIFLELMAFEGYTRVRPEFYERMLLRKVARDDTSSANLEHIYNTIQIDIGCVFDFGGISTSLWSIAAYPESSAAPTTTIAGIKQSVLQEYADFVNLVNKDTE